MKFLAYDDDCGVCTKAAYIFSRFLGIPIVPMHDPILLEIGVNSIGEDLYWKSFHIVDGRKWTYEEDAIIELSSIFPIGQFLAHIVRVPPVLQFLMFILRKMQLKRKLECSLL